VMSAYRVLFPNLQRWGQRDPIEEDGGMNLYTYVQNNPINYFDPLGLDGVDLGPGGMNPDNIQNLADLEREAAGLPRPPLSPEETEAARDAFGQGLEGSKKICDEAVKKLGKDTLNKLKQIAQDGLKKALKQVQNAGSDSSKNAALKAAETQLNRLNAINKALRALGALK
jgi:uncharacterized protein RhaS with RHS repeats